MESRGSENDTLGIFATILTYGYLFFFIHKHRDNCVQYASILIVFTDHQVMLFPIDKQKYIFLQCVLYQQILLDQRQINDSEKLL